MNRRKGHTLAELSVVMTLTVAVTATGVALYAFAADRTARSFARLSSITSSTKCLDEIAATVEEAVSCTAVTQMGQVALKCDVPAAKTDLNGDGRAEGYRPSAIAENGYERFQASRLVWFFVSDSSGTFGKSGTILWRAESGMALVPTAGDLDAAWSRSAGTTVARVGNVSQWTVSVNAASRSVTVAIKLDDGLDADAATVAKDLRSGLAVTLSRTATWRRWR